MGLKLAYVMCLEASRGKGLEIQCTYFRNLTAGEVMMSLKITNHALTPMFDFAIQFNKNSFGLKPTKALEVGAPLMSHNFIEVTLPLATNGPVNKSNPLMSVQV